MSTFFAICFDVADKHRLRKVAIALEDHGIRVQNSLFECYLDESELENLKSKLTGIIDAKVDHVRFYTLCGKDRNKVRSLDNFLPSLAPEFHLE
jgi:CRISPR-associated protein Cas2